ncbi:MAG: hypothetical protein ACLGIV_09420 [Actinomycetes bacterium]
MPEFAQAIEAAIAAARTDLDQARVAGDIGDVIVHEGRLEDLRRLALENGVPAA